MKPLVVIDVVGLTHDMLGPNTPHLSRLASLGFSRPMSTVLPAVTCSAQSSLLTGLLPRDHGVVGNGWYFRDLAEVGFWKQSNGLVQGEKLYEAARHRDPKHTTAKMFWWYNMYSSADIAVTPRPMYPSDGRKLPDIWTTPGNWLSGCYRCPQGPQEASPAVVHLVGARAHAPQTSQHDLSLLLGGLLPHGDVSPLHGVASPPHGDSPPLHGGL